jgi:hypothetical protein
MRGLTLPIPYGRSPRNSPLFKTRLLSQTSRHFPLPLNHPTPNMFPVLFLSLIPDALRTVLAVKGRYAVPKPGTPLTAPGPFSNTPPSLDEGKVRSEMRANPEPPAERPAQAPALRTQDKEARKFPFNFSHHSLDNNNVVVVYLI